MENTRFTQGMEQLKTIDGRGGENVIKSLEDIAPDLGKFIVEYKMSRPNVQKILYKNVQLVCLL